MSDDRVGQRLGGWRLERVLGEGGLTTLYAGRHEPTGTPGAVRVFSPPIAARGWERVELAVAAFFRAGFGHRLGESDGTGHPGIVQVLDLGAHTMNESSNEVVHYLVEELVEGITVRRALERGPLPLDQAIRILDQTLAALIAAHRAGFVHGDLRPENVFLTRSTDGLVQVKIGDLHLARSIPGWTAQRDGFLGVPEHMAPEQIRGTEISDRTDIWAVGILAFELSSGTRPFERSGASALAIMEAVLNDPRPELPASVPAPLAELVRRCLEEKPTARPDAEALRAGLAT